MLRLRPISLRDANEYVRKYHRHHKPVAGHKFSIGCEADGELVGVIIVGRPVSRYLDDGFTLEVTRLCTNGAKNACSFLYGAAARAAAAMGYKRIITYTLESENGASLRASGWMIHSQCEFSTFFLARRIAEELDVPLVHTYHTVYEDYTHYFSPSVRWGRCAVAAFSRWVAAQVDGMIAPTGKVRGLLQGYGVRCPVFVVPTGIDLRRFQQEGDPMRRAVLRASLGIPAENTVLVCVGRLAEEKNIQELLKLRASLGSRPVTLLLVGDGPDRPRLEQVAHDLRLEAPAVIFAGMVPPEEVPEWYRLGDLFVSASSSETQGLTYIEALAAGVPALCRADLCLEGVILEGENGWQYHSTVEFRQRLEEFLASPETHEALKRRAAESAEQFSAQRFAQRVERIYQMQLARRAASCVQGVTA